MRRRLCADLTIRGYWGEYRKARMKMDHATHAQHHNPSAIAADPPTGLGTIGTKATRSRCSATSSG